METKFKAKDTPPKRRRNTPKTEDRPVEHDNTTEGVKVQEKPAKQAESEAKQPSNPTPEIIQEMDGFIQLNGIKKKDFYAKLGYSNTYIQKVRNGTRELTDDLAGVIEKTIKGYFSQEPDEDMDIEAMSHSRLWNEIVHNGMSFTFRASDPLWQEAFRRYNEAHNSNLKPTCPGCFKKVKDWIKRV